VHNWYSLEYNRIVFELLERRFGKHEAVLFARSGTAGGQRFPVHWGGDCESTWEAMSESLRGGLGLTLSGYGFHSHDMGGFEGTPDETLFNRWLGYGLFSSHSRLHGSGSYRVPWIYGESCSAILAKLTMAKHRLMPYIYAAAVEAHETGVPIMRAMMLEFPEDLSTGYLDKQVRRSANPKYLLTAIGLTLM
jgi:alpha-D-xyloside xylohydrolase